MTKKYIKRHLEQIIEEASSYYPVVMLCGQRQVGKSTMLNHIKEEKRRYVTLDDRNAFRLAVNDPGLFFETYGLPILIDEFQRVPELTLEIKRIVDEKNLAGEDTAGLFWLTGSQSFKMMKNVADSLAGRIGIFTMSSLSCAEIESRTDGIFSTEPDSLRNRARNMKKKNIHQIYEQIFKGGMPFLYSSNAPRERYYADYINTYLERDIKDLAQVGKLNEFYDFLVFMAARTAQELKYEEISRSLGISAPTAKHWVSILERSGIIHILKPYSPNITSRLVKTPKFYFSDTGLAAYLCRWPNAETLENGAMSGAFFETFVVSEILKSYFNSGIEPDICYYRDIDKKEIDLLLNEGGKIIPAEIKKAKNPEGADKNFKVLEKLGKAVGNGLIICMCDEVLPYSKNVWMCPAALI